MIFGGLWPDKRLHEKLSTRFHFGGFVLVRNFCRTVSVCSPANTLFWLEIFGLILTLKYHHQIISGGKNLIQTQEFPLSTSEFGAQTHPLKETPSHLYLEVLCDRKVN